MEIGDHDLADELSYGYAPAIGARPDVEPLLSDRVLSHCREVTLAPGEELFSQGARHTSTFIIRDGLVRTFFTAASGREVTMAYCSRGDLVGGPDFFGGFHVWSCRAMRPSRVAAISGDKLRKLANENPDIYGWITDVMAFKIRWLSILLQLHGTEAVGPRLAKLLLMLADIYGVPTSEGTVIRHRMNQTDLATLVGASRQWTNKTLRKLAARNLLTLDGQLITILDRNGLHAMSLAET